MANNKLRYELELDSTSYRTGTEEAIKSTKSLKQSTKEYLDSFGSLKKQMNAAKKEAQNLAAQFAMLGEAEKNSEFGKELAENLQIAIEKAAELQDVFADTNDAIKNAASDTAGLDALKEVFEISKDATTAYIGVLGRLTNSEKELKNVVSSLAAVQGSFNAVIKTTNALQKNSATMIALQRSGVLSLAQAEKISAAATKASTVAVKGLGIAMKALPYVAVAAGVLAVGKAFVNLMTGANKAVKPVEDINKKLTGTQKILADVANAYTSNYASALGKTMSLYRQLQSSYQQMSSTHEKTKWIKENSDKLKELGISTKDVNEVDRILINQSEQVIESFKLRAEVAAEAARLQSLYTQKIEAEAQARERASKNKFKKDQEIHGDDVSRYGLEEGKDYYTSKYTSGMFLTDEGAMKAQKAAAEKNVQNYTKDIQAEIDKSANKLNDATNKYNEILKGLGITNFSKTDVSKVTKEQITQLEKLSNDVKKYQTQLENLDPKSLTFEIDKERITKQLEDAKKAFHDYKVLIGVEVEKPKPDALEGWKKELKDLQLKINPVVDQKTLDEVWNKIHDLEDEEEEIQIQIDAELDPDKKQQLIDQLNEIKKQIEQQKLLLNTGIDPKSAKSLLDELDSLREEAKDLEELKINPELDETKKAEIDAKLQVIYDKISKLMSNIPVGLDEASLRQLIQRIEELEAQIEQREVEIGVKVEPKSDDKDVKKVQDILNDVNKKITPPKYDFEFIPDDSKNGKKAKDLLDKYNTLVDARKRLTDVMNTSTDDQAIHDAQIGIDGLNESISDLEPELDKFDKLNEKYKDFKKISDAAGKAGQYLGDLASSFSKLGEATQNTGIQAVGIVMETIANLALSFSKAMIQASELGPFGWIAFAIAGAAQLAATIAQIKSLTAGSYAEGGVVPGSSFTGDKLLARVNSGERILTSKQNENLEKIANGVNGQGIVTEQRIQVIGKIKGTDILLVSKNTNKLLSKSGTNISF